MQCSTHSRLGGTLHAEPQARCLLLDVATADLCSSVRSASKVLAHICCVLAVHCAISCVDFPE
jgi:hypothetical protein